MLSEVKDALQEAQGNQVQAAIKLNVTARTVSNWVREHQELKDICTHFRRLRGKGPTSKRNNSLDIYEMALRETGGFMTRAAELLNVTQSAVSQRIRSSTRLQAVMEEIEEQYLDLSEGKLISLINKEDLGAIKFYLRCKGVRRGYIERNHLDVSTPGDQTWEIKRVIIDPKKSTDN